MKKLKFLLLLLFLNSCAVSLSVSQLEKIKKQEKKQKDIAAIKKMCGCFKVRFQFAETFSYSDDPNYKPSKIKDVGALEWVALAEEKKDTLVLQHLLVIDMGEKPFVQKHWRQDWIYENRNFFVYDGDNVWRFLKKNEKDVRGQWTQKVYQVDDSPRYEGTGSWVQIDGKHYWESTANAPLPRRERTIRSDYNILHRRNRHLITKKGWDHEQDNRKILKKGEKKKILAEEKGYDTYTKVPDSLCKAAVVYWNINKQYWEKVRKSWAKVFSKEKTIKLKKKVGNRKIMNLLFSFEREDVNSKKIDDTINNFTELKEN